MRYTDYEGFTKPYVLVHNTGFGTPEDNYEEVGPVGEADTWEEAVALSDQLKAENNPAKDIDSRWCYNTYQININTLHPEGKRLLEIFHQEADRLSQYVKDHPEQYHTHKEGDFTFHFQRIPEFDDVPPMKVELVNVLPKGKYRDGDEIPPLNPDIDWSSNPNYGD